MGEQPMIALGRYLVVATLTLGLSAGTAMAQSSCTAPSAPTPLSFEALPRPKTPDKPACVEKNRCSGGDVDRYNAAIAQYNASLFDFNQKRSERESKFNAYVSSLNQFANLTELYLNCERTRLVTVLDAGG
jgi:hypothetical protein